MNISSGLVEQVCEQLFIVLLRLLIPIIILQLRSHCSMMLSLPPPVADAVAGSSQPSAADPAYTELCQPSVHSSLLT